MGTGIGGTHARKHRKQHDPDADRANQELFSKWLLVSDLKPGRALAFEHYAVQFAGRTLILAKYAVATPHPTAAFSASHFAARDVLVPTAVYVLDVCKAFGLLLPGAARP
jgi:hypothetical protein